MIGAIACKGLAYYQGKSVEFISDSPPGAAFDSIPRVLGPYMSKFLGANVTTTDIAGGGTIGGQDALAAAPPNGLTIGEGNPTGVLLANALGLPSVNFNLAREDFIGAVPQGAQVILVNPKLSSVTTFKGLITTPGLKIIGTCQGQPYLFSHMLDAIWGAHITYVCGFSGAGPVVQGFVAGDAPLAVNALSQQGPLLENRVGIPVATSQPSVKGLNYASLLGDALTPAQAGKEFPPKTKAEQQELAIGETTINGSNDIIMMPSKTPGPETQIIRDAVIWGMKQSAVQDALLNQGVTDRLLSVATSKKIYLNVVKNIAVLTKIMESTPAP